ncbi:MAG: hypothetical protein F6K19_23390 [Cyanothece sp. SIO1E1]|nr:hypothetical protein [Cyanothece sp. SIO1E1]
MRRSILSSVFSALSFAKGYPTDSYNSSSRLDELQQVAVVSHEIYPGRVGRAKFQGSWWPVACDQDIYIAPGTRVAVVGRHNITLLVEPLPTMTAASHIPSEEKAYQ